MGGIGGICAPSFTDVGLGDSTAIATIARALDINILAARAIAVEALPKMPQPPNQLRKRKNQLLLAVIFP